MVRKINRHIEGSDNGLFLSALCSASADGEPRAMTDMLMCLTALAQRAREQERQQRQAAREGEWGEREKDADAL